MTAVSQASPRRRKLLPPWLRSFAPWIGGARPVWFVALPAAGLLVFLQASSLAATMSLYWADGSRLVAAAVGMTVPVVCCAAAWQVGRLRTSGVLRVAVARSRLSIVCGALVPAVCVGLLGQGLAWLTVARYLRDVPGAPDLRWAATSCAWTLAAAALGGAVGRWSPLVVGLPVSLLVPYAASAAPMGMVTPWPRHVTPFVTLRLSVADLPDPRLVVAQLASAAMVIALSAAALSVRSPGLPGVLPWVLPALACTAVAAASGGLAVGAARGLDYQAWVPRPAANTVCREGPGVPICLFPEQQAVRTQVETAVGRILPAALELGFSAPVQVTAAMAAPPDAWSGITLDARRGNAADGAVLSAAVLQVVGSCPAASSASYEAAQIVDLLLAAATRNSDTESGEDRLPPDVLDLAVNNPAALQGWVAQLGAAARSCSATSLPALQAAR